MAATLGAETVLCGFIGGEAGATLRPLLELMPGDLRLVETAGSSGSYVVDRRDGERRQIATALAPPPSRHEADELFSVALGAAVGADALVVCNPFPGDGFPAGLYRDLVADARSAGTPVLVDLSTPRLDRALEGGPDLVKLNDWELAEYVYGPVYDEPGQLRAAAERLQAAGAASVIVTRAGDPALALRDGEALEVAPPKLERGHREGCGDSMMGALATALAGGAEWRDALVLGTAAGAANFLRHGLGSASAQVVEDLARRVEVRPA